MKFRIVEKDKKFYPQYREWYSFAWSSYKTPYWEVQYDSYKSAKEYIEDRIKKSEELKQARKKIIHKVKL
jgi:hypothetical protein